MRVAKYSEGVVIATRSSEINRNGLPSRVVARTAEEVSRAIYAHKGFTSAAVLAAFSHIERKKR